MYFQTLFVMSNSQPMSIVISLAYTYVRVELPRSVYFRQVRQHLPVMPCRLGQDRLIFSVRGRYAFNTLVPPSCVRVP